MSTFSERRNRKAFLKAEKAAKTSEGMVVGYKDAEGIPQYMVAPRDISEEDLRNLVFVAKHGREMNRAEELLSAAANGDFIRAYEAAIKHYYSEPVHATAD
jgi:hypothetical protein